MSSVAHQGNYHKFVAVCVITLLGTMSQAGAQGFWTITNTDTEQATAGQAQHFPDGNNCLHSDSCQEDHAIIIMEPDLFKKDFVGRSFASCTRLATSCPLRAAGLTQAEVDGDGTETLVFGWDLISRANNNCKVTGIGSQAVGDFVAICIGIGNATTADARLDLVWIVGAAMQQIRLSTRPHSCCFRAKNCDCCVSNCRGFRS